MTIMTMLPSLSFCVIIVICVIVAAVPAEKGAKKHLPSLTSALCVIQFIEAEISACVALIGFSDLTDTF